MPFIPLEKYPEFKILQEYHKVIAEELQKVKNTYWNNWSSDAKGPDGKAMFLNKEGEWTFFPVYAGTEKAVSRHPFLMNLPPDILKKLMDLVIRTFPKTTELLRPLKRVNYAAFSRIKGHSELGAHSHNNLGSLILHLGMKIPPEGSCGLQVGNDVHIWQKPGDMVIFNDNNIHSAWNRSDAERIIFYADFICDDPHEGLVLN